MRISLILAALVLATMPASAQDCEWTSSFPEVDVLGFYVDHDPCHECIFSIWVYEETNGIPGLQRNDDVKDDTCGGVIPSDTILF